MSCPFDIDNPYSLLPWKRRETCKNTNFSLGILVSASYKQIKKGYLQKLSPKLANKACILITNCWRFLLLHIAFSFFSQPRFSTGSLMFPSILMQFISTMILIITRTIISCKNKINKLQEMTQNIPGECTIQPKYFMFHTIFCLTFLNTFETINVNLP